LGNIFGQNKTLIALVPFKDPGDNSNQQQNYGYNRNNRSSNGSQTEYTIAIQDAVSDAFLKTKRFSLVERDKMDKLKSENNLQKSDDFIDGSVIEQSKTLGAQYVVLGNISKGSLYQKTTTAPFVGNVTSYDGEIAFNIRVVDVATGEIMASNSFSASEKGKTGFEDALKEIKPQIEKFIKDNFKLSASIASVEEKNSNGDATKVLISGGSSNGVSVNNSFRVYELSEMEVDGKKLARKKTLGTIVVEKIEDENFSICTVKEGGADIAKKVAAGAKVKCEIIE
jgi:hypothetical protein